MSSSLTGYVIVYFISHSLAPLNCLLGDSSYNSDTVIFPACHWLDQNHLIFPFCQPVLVTCEANRPIVKPRLETYLEQSGLTFCRISVRSPRVSYRLQLTVRHATTVKLVLVTEWRVLSHMNIVVLVELDKVRFAVTMGAVQIDEQMV